MSPQTTYCSACAVFVMLLCSCQPQPTAGAPGLGDEHMPLLGNGGYDVQSYTIQLDVDPLENFVVATTTIDSIATDNLASFNLDFQGLTVDSVTVDEAPSAFRQEGAELVVVPDVPLQNGASFNVRVSYHGSPQPVPIPVYSGGRAGWFHAPDGSINAWNEPNGASTWFPANDHPLDKATYRFEVTVPPPWVVAASGTPLEQSAQGDEVLYTWEMNHPLASYLAMISIDRFSVTETKTPNGIPIRIYVPEGVHPDWLEPLAATPAMISYFSSIFGPYPFDSYGVVVIFSNSSSVPASGEETQSMTLLAPGAISEGIHAHELAHQWFGDSVSLESWQDIWLKEGVATYAEWMWAFREQPLSQLTAHAARMNRFGWNAPIGRPPLGSIYTDATYNGAALLFHELRLTVGEEVFFQILREYQERYRHGNASADDFIELSSEIAQRNLKPFFDLWLNATEPPTSVAPAN